MRTQYPLMIDLTSRPCLVVGAGHVARRKIESLLAAGANVTVIAPQAEQAVACWAEQGKIKWVKAPYESQDVSRYILVVAATDQPEVNLSVYRDVEARGGWINVVDRPDLCNFIVPSVVRRGKLVIAVSTSGASPSLARKIKQEIEREYGTEYESYVDFLAGIRQQVLREVDDPQKRRQIFQKLLDDAYVAASEEQRHQMAKDLLATFAGAGRSQGGHHETCESRITQEHACVNPNQLGD